MDIVCRLDKHCLLNVYCCRLNSRNTRLEFHREPIISLLVRNGRPAKIAFGGHSTTVHTRHGARQPSSSDGHARPNRTYGASPPLITAPPPTPQPPTPGAATSRLILNEGVSERLVDGEPFARVDDEDLLKEVTQLGDLLQLVVRQTLVTNHLGQQVLTRRDRTHHGHLLL